MPVNIKLTKDLTNRIVPDCTPEKAVREYYISVSAERQEKKKPEWDIARYSPATELISKQRQLEEVTGRLLDKRQEEKVNREELDQRWLDLQEEETHLRNSFIKFNQFVKDNLDKRERAERKINEERNTQNKKRQELESLRNQLRYFTQAREKMQKCVTQYKIYENYLESVAASTNEFKSIYDIFPRYEILMDTQAELAAKQVKDLEEMEQLRNEMTHLDQEKEQMLMGINNEMTELETKYDEAKQRSWHWETFVQRIKTISVMKKTEIAEVKTSVWNLYDNVRKSGMVVPQKTQDDTEGQLMEIKEAMHIFKIVLQKIKRRAAFDSKMSLQDFRASQPTEKKKLITADDLQAMEEAEERKRIIGIKKMEAKKKLEAKRKQGRGKVRKKF